MNSIEQIEALFGHSTSHPTSAASPTPAAQEVRPATTASAPTAGPAPGGTTVISNPIVEVPPGAPGGIASGALAPAPQGDWHGADELSEAQAQALADQILQVGQALAPYGEVLDPAVKKHAGQPRAGLEQQIPLLTSLAARYGVSWPTYPLSQFGPDIDLVNRLTEIDRPVVALGKLISDSIFAIRASYYKPVQGIYGVLSKIAANDNALAEELIPLRRFFATKPATKGKGKPKGKTQPGNQPSGDPGNASSPAPAASPAGSSGTGAAASAAAPVVAPVARAGNVIAPNVSVVRSHERRRLPRLDYRA